MKSVVISEMLDGRGHLQSIAGGIADPSTGDLPHFRQPRHHYIYFARASFTTVH